MLRPGCPGHTRAPSPGLGSTGPPCIPESLLRMKALPRVLTVRLLRLALYPAAPLTIDCVFSCLHPDFPLTQLCNCLKPGN